MPPKRPPRRPLPRRGKAPQRQSRAPQRFDGWFPPPSKPIPVEGGLVARSQRGQIGDTWWSQRFITLLESVGFGGRLQRGKRYARTGQVISMDVKAGQVTASVQGSRTKPYKVFIVTEVLTDVEWDAAEALMAQSAVFMAKLLAGDMPEEIEEAFAGSSGPLLPESADAFDSACSCPDWENPCKHIAAVYFLLAEAFDRDPFLIFSWRGRDKETLLTGLRARRRSGSQREQDPAASAVSPASSDSTAATEAGQFGWPVVDSDSAELAHREDPASLWGRESDLADLMAHPVRPRLAVAPDLLLRQLDPEPLGPYAPRIEDALRPMYESMTARAAEIAIGGETKDEALARWAR
jgi:uncharacterized Zn finger protein